MRLEHRTVILQGHAIVARYEPANCAYHWCNPT